jgi:hypothetical protein
MALPCIADDWDTAPILTKRAVSRKRPTYPHFLSQCLGAWPATVASPTISPPWVCSTAEASSFDDFDVSSSPGAGTAQDPPYLSTDTPFSISLNQPIPSVCAARYSRLWPVVDLTDCQSRASRCSSTFSAGRDTTSSAVGLQNSISGKAKKQERDVQNASVNTALGTVEHVLDTFDCRHCEKTFATRSTLRSVLECCLARRRGGLLTSSPVTMRSSMIPSELTSTTAQHAREDSVILKTSRDTLAPTVKLTSLANMLARCVTRRSRAATISDVTKS